MSDPRWITRPIILAIHADQLNQHGGLPGVRDPGALESSLNRAPNRFHYVPSEDLAGLAAAYGFGIATSHPFLDGNKRTAFQAMYVFLGLNGIRIVAQETEVVQVMLGVAAGEVDESALAEWLRMQTEPRR